MVSDKRRSQSTHDVRRKILVDYHVGAYGPTLRIDI
jgi:hypothetical protein